MTSLKGVRQRSNDAVLSVPVSTKCARVSPLEPWLCLCPASLSLVQESNGDVDPYNSLGAVTEEGLLTFTQLSGTRASR